MTTIQFRRGSDSQWSTANPTLAVGEPGYDTDTGAVLVGDGSSAWTDLRPLGAQVRATATSATTYTVAAVDVGTVVETTSGSAVAVTVAGLAAGDVVEFTQYGAGQITFAADTGVTLRSASGLKTRTQYSCVALRWRTSTEVIVSGDLTT